MTTIPFEQLPSEVSFLREEIKELKSIVKNWTRPKADEAMSLDKVVEIDPLKRAKSTFYSYTQNPNSGFPFRKRGKHIIVMRSEFDSWLLLGKRKTSQEIQDETDELLSKN